MILPSDMVGHEVDQHFHSRAVSALDKADKLVHAVRHVDGQIRVDVIVVGYGVGAAGVAFDDMRVVARYAVCRVVGVVGVFDDTGIPDMGETHRLDFLEYRVVDVV